MAKKKRRDYTDMPEKIPDSPENIMKAILNTPPRKAEEWKYLQKEKEKA